MKVSTILCLFQRKRLSGGLFGDSVPRGWRSQEEQATEQQEACLQSLAARSTETSRPYPGGARGSTSKASCSTGGGPAASEGLGGLGEPCAHPEMGGARMSNVATFQVKPVQPRGRLLFGPPRVTAGLCTVTTNRPGLRSPGPLL